MQGGGGLSLDQLIQFDWEVALGDIKLSFEELQALARLKAPLVKVRGQWVQMSAEEIQAALDLWKKKAEKQATAREIVQMALGAQDSQRAALLLRASRERMGGRPSGTTGGPRQVRGIASARRLPREPATLPDAGLLVAELPAAVELWRMSGRRYGAWAKQSRPWPSSSETGIWRLRRRPKTRAVDLSHIGGQQLAKGSQPLYAGSAGYGPPRTDQGQGCCLQEGGRASRLWSFQAMPCCIGILNS